MMSSSRATVRSSSKTNVESRMARRREKEYDHQTKWNGQVNYYQLYERQNKKYEDWTSPRYYETNNKMIGTLKNERERKDNLEKRRNKLKKLLDEDNRTYEIETSVHNRYKPLSKRPNEIPTELLKNVHLGIKLDEDERKRREAELALYHHWRNNNPVLRDHERTRNAKDVKLSWLDQQIEKRLEKEKTEKECRKQIAETERRLAEEKENEEREKRASAERNEKLRLELEKQIEELLAKQKESEMLQKREEEEMKRIAELEDMEERRKVEEKRTRTREVAIENLKHHKLKLKEAAKNVQENLEWERNFLKGLIDSEVAENIENETKKSDVTKAMDEFFRLSREQQELERQRQKYFDFVFDSEAKAIYDRQNTIWLEERRARDALMKDVMNTIKNQLEDKMTANKERRREVLKERETIVQMIEQDRQNREKQEEEERRKKEEWKKQIEVQLNEKKAIANEARLHQQKEIDLELERAAKEEEKLRREIMELQRRQGPIRHTRSRILF